jgi:pantoate--beta-alanine ligase
MDVCNTISAIRQYRQSAGGKPVVFVPTMGALHEGHGSLVRLARQRAGPHGIVAASIFVNPTQFGPQEDFHKYPRPFDLDVVNLTQWGADVVFAPVPEEMYPAGTAITVDPGPLGDVLEGAIRPGHFRGVCTVVAKLLNIVQPSMMILGQKDFQQQLILRRMISDLNMPVEVMTAPTLREPDGLAMSSRNRYLSAEQRGKAGAIYSALHWAGQQYRSGVQAAVTLESGMRDRLLGAGLEVQYALACHAETLAPLIPVVHAPCVLLIAAKLGTTRLIDNLVL